MNQSPPPPPAPEYPIRTVRIFSKIRGDICKSSAKCTTGIKFPPWHRRQILPPVPYCHRCQRYLRQICHRYQQRWWQLATSINDTSDKCEQLSDCWQLKMNLKKNSYLNANFSCWRFLPFATGVNYTGGAPLAANISANFRKNSKLPFWCYQGFGGNWSM